MLRCRETAMMAAMRFFLLRATAVLLLLLCGLSLSSSLRASAEGDDLRAADAELNAAYQVTLDALPGNATRAKLREAQRAWIAFRDAEIELNGALPGASGNNLKMLQTELTETRTKQLKALAEAAR